MEISCQIHPVEFQSFQLYHYIGQMIQLNPLQRPKASDVRSIVREELTEKTYIYINQKLIFFIFQQIFSHIVFILLYTNDYSHPHPHPQIILLFNASSQQIQYIRQPDRFEFDRKSDRILVNFR